MQPTDPYDALNISIQFASAFDDMPTFKSSIDFDLRQLEIFLNVVDLKSFSKAAQAVHLAQASVSERISNLETLVGTRLLDRLGREVVPTRAGELLYKHASLLLEMKRTACLEMARFLGVQQGELRVGGSTIPGEYILPGIIGLFGQKYPAISVSLTISDSRAVERRVLDGTFELGVVGSRSSDTRLVLHQLWKDELVLVVHATHPWAGKAAVAVEALFDEPFILREKGSGTFGMFDHYLQKNGSKGVDALNRVARLGTSTAVKEGIKAGVGVSVLSARAVETEVTCGILKVLRIKKMPMFRSFYLIRDRRRIASPICRTMIDFLQASASSEEKIR